MNPHDLMQAVRADLLNAYQPDGTQPQSGDTTVFLAFETIGLPIAPAMFLAHPDDATPSPQLAVEHVSDLCNTVPNAAAATFVRTQRKVDDEYELLLKGSQPSNGIDVTTFGAVKAPALTKFSVRLAALEGLFEYHPTYAFPGDWYDETNERNWTSRTFADRVAGDPTANEGGRGSGGALPPLAWKVMPDHRAPLLDAQPVDAAAGLGSAIGSLFGVKTGAQPPRTIATATSVLSVLRGAAQLAGVPQNSTGGWKALDMAETMLELATNATTQPVSSTQMTMQFAYCAVRLSRPWYSRAFLTTPGWYVPGFAAGAFSSGNNADEEGAFSVVPIGFIAVKNLVITADWSATDAAAATSSASIGPFSLVGRSFDPRTSTLRCDGAQIIAWVCETQPSLPPDADPRL